MNFLSSKDLSISNFTHGALIEVLDRLERGIIVHVPDAGWAKPPTTPNGFNMFDWHCGTCHCLGGWCKELADTHEKYMAFMKDLSAQDFRLRELFYPPPDQVASYRRVTAEHAARVLRVYLETGEVKW